MSIFKDSFKPGVKAQITARQNAIGSTSRSSDTIQYFNSRNSWIRMSSAVDVKGDGGILASKCILQGGTLTNIGVGLVLKSGVGSGNQAYSTTTPGGQLNRLGIRPMPGITSLEVKSKSAYGSLREANVSFQCWDIRQLEELELLYMRAGYSVLVEWGWAPYLDNNGALQSNIPLPPYLFQKKKKEQIWSETFTRASKDGNYDAVYGLVKNYSWKARSDGGYDCSVSIITMGEVLESLKINYGAFDKANIQTQGLFPIASSTSAFASSTTGATITSAILSSIGSGIFTSGGFAAGSALLAASSIIIKDDVSAAYAQNIVAGICAELYNLAVSNAPSTDEAYWPLKDTNNSGYVYNFIKYKVQMSSSGPTITDGTTQIYIKLADFIEILNYYVLLSDKKNKTPLAKLSVHEPDATYSGGKGNPLLCLGNIHQISTNPHVCLIRNKAYEDPKTNLGVEDLDVTAVKKYLSVMAAFDYLDLSTEFGEIGNVFVNLDYLYGLSLNDTLAEKDKKEKNDIILFDYIKSMMSGINTAIGNVANFDIFIDPVDSVARIIDVNYVDTTKRSDAYANAFEIQVHNLNSTVRDYSLESQIFPEQSTMVAIGAQVKGGALGTNTDTLVDYNRGLVDRIIPQKDAPTAPPNSSVADEIAKLEALQKNWAVIADLFIQLNPDWFSAGDYDVEESSKYANALKDIINYFNSIINSNIKNRAIIPTKLSLTMDGIGGMIIGNMFKINDDVLPAGYKGKTINSDIGSRIGYVVTGLGHKVNNNDWTTQVDAQFVVLDEPKGIDKSNLPVVKAINRTVTSAPLGSLGSLAGAPPPPGSVSAIGFGLPLASPYNIVSFLTRATSKTYGRPVTVGSDPNHQGLDMQGPNGGTKEITKSAIVGGLGTTGDGIFSVQAGKVIEARGGVGGFENWVYIHHTIGGKLYTSIYGHMALRSILVKAGDTVTRGQQIASVGNEGTSTGYHLHFELWEGDRSKLLDPMDYLPFFKSNGGNIPDGTIPPGKYS
jgi:hypothetical protein